ncbi:macrophage mannose receptor 1 [Trichonephila inaurata madagascariensis]|uniref:Macrophage mannose receptor 1 n=1 Tax=Trichonephila inaurata madagascariensis TaxID=2747483 RepID=A0A8X6WUQ6_9ARAC|nr:macrophage mannose receptor 1 [Trichonephila inaurata madagascariensis]
MLNSANQYWVKEDSTTAATATPVGECPFISQLKLDYTNCAQSLHFICELPDENNEKECPLGWILYNSKCYKTVKQQSNYTESLSTCSSEGGRLAVLDDETKEQNVQAIIIGTDDFYVVDAVRENGTFEWTSGVPFAPACSVCVNFTSNGNCLGIKSSKSHPTMFHWDNVDCSAKNSFLCEMTALEKPSTSSEPPPRKLCPIGYNWKAYRNTDYCFWETTYETERLNWYQARQFCQGYGGDLATYSSSNEEDHGLGGAKGHYKGLWFGLERGTDDVFRWVDGTNLNYTNWNYGEPRIRSYKYCASHAPGTGRWELDYCGVRRWFVCKAPKVETPTLPDIKFEKKLCNITTTSVYRQWYLYENHCYLIHDDPKYSWDLAQNFCQDNDAHLTSVHSFNETNFILFAGNIVASSEYWIGLAAKGLGSSYTWSDGTPLDFLYWKDESDLNQTERVNTCVTFNHLRGFWTTSHCNRLLGVICKRGVNSSYVFPTQEPTPVLPGNCEEGWYLLGNQCYKVFGKKWTQRQTWQNAQYRCENESATLASIHNEKQQNFLTDLILEVDDDAWIGLKYFQRETLFQWIDESAFDYADWDVDEPSFSNDEGDSFNYVSVYQRSCVKLNYGRINMGKWNDESGKYVSLNNKRLAHSNWLAGQPVTISVTMDNCVAVNSDAKWMVRSCRENLNFICEWNSGDEKEVVVDESHLCPKIQGWIDIGGDLCIKTYLLQKSWNEAMLYCLQHGGSLTTFHSQQDLQLFTNYVNSYFRYTSVHIGLARRKDGSYMWVDYSPVDFVAWDPEDPRSVTKDCVELDMRSEKWRKVLCDGIRRNFFCSASKQRDSNKEALVSNFTRADDMINQKLAIGGIFGIIICLIVVIAIISLTVYYMCPLRRMRSKLLIPDAQ